MSTLSEKTQKWIEAAKKLRIHPDSDVLCPENEDASLIVTDIPFALGNKFERILKCPRCGARNIIYEQEGIVILSRPVVENRVAAAFRIWAYVGPVAGLSCHAK